MSLDRSSFEERLQQRLSLPNTQEARRITLDDLPNELLSMILCCPVMEAEDAFTLKVASRLFMHLQPDFTTLRNQFTSQGKWRLACRLNRKVEESYLCSACLTRHEYDLFEDTQRLHSDLSRKCRGVTGAITLFRNFALTFDCISKTRAGFQDRSGERNIDRCYVLNGYPDQPTSALFQNWTDFAVDSEVAGCKNVVSVGLKPVNVDSQRHVILVWSMRMYIPFLEYMLAASRDSKFDYPLVSAWYRCLLPWNAPFCEHFQLADEKFGQSVIQLAKECPTGENCRRKWSGCGVCGTTIGFKFAKETQERDQKRQLYMSIQVERGLGALNLPSSKHWLRHLINHQLKYRRFGERWDMAIRHRPSQHHRNTIQDIFTLPITSVQYTRNQESSTQ